MPTIEIKKTREEPGEASLAVTVPAENVRAAEERAAAVWQARARLPGFRKGKVPMGRAVIGEDGRRGLEGPSANLAFTGRHADGSFRAGSRVLRT